jgi:lysozyme
MTLKEELLTNVGLAEDFEGFEGLPYECPAGFQTIGFGRNLEVYPYTRGEAIEWTSIKMAELRAKIMEECIWLVDHPPEVRIILVDMAYNLGIRGLFNFANRGR